MWLHGKKIKVVGQNHGLQSIIGLPDVPWLKTCTFGEGYYVAIWQKYNRWWGQNMALEIYWFT
jgi:hypothetical protein